MPASKSLVMNLQDQAQIDAMKKNPITIKEGIEYRCMQFLCLRNIAISPKPLASE